jgi:hypothetical protein
MFSFKVLYSRDPDFCDLTTVEIAAESPRVANDIFLRSILDCFSIMDIWNGEYYDSLKA